ncbi:MAG TPA: hypothetical protein VF407_02910 [Polyangiaceae bacterium]
MASVAKHLSARALCVYAEPLVLGKRVLVVGDGSDGIAERLMDLGARMVHLYEVDEVRAQGVAPARGVTVHVLPAHDFDVRDGAFDLAIVPDLAAVADRAAVLARLRRIVGRDGAALVGAQNPSARAPSNDTSIDYYELYELVSLQFEAVRMIGQVPFAGVALVELGVAEEDSEVTVDAQLAGEAAPPEWFVALASQNDARLAEYAIVQLPRAIDETPPNSVGTRASIAESTLRADVLAAQLEEKNVKTRELETRASEAMAMADRMSADASRAEERFATERDRLRAQVASLEEEVAARAARTAVLEGTFGAMEEAARDLEKRAAAAERAAEEHAEKIAGLIAELDEAHAAASVAAELNGSALSHEGEVAELEATLRSRGTYVAEIERELARREQIVHDLISQLAAPPPVANGVHGPAAKVVSDRTTTNDSDAALYEENVRLRAKLDALALDLARREGELQTKSWRVTELEEELAHGKKSHSEPPVSFGTELRGSTASLRAELDRARDELDILRRALAQSHEARAREGAADT